jgi:YHS domain-containing protein
MRALALLVPAFGAAAALAAAAAPASAPTIDRWTCATDKEMRMLAKGPCPICTADLVKVAEPMRGAGAAGDPYPLATCPVSDQPLGSRGAPIVMSIGGREVRFCCAGCIAPFKRDPAAHWKKIDEAIVKQQKEAYPLDVCVVSKEKLGDAGGRTPPSESEVAKPVDHVYRNRLVRLCCKSCVKSFEKEPDAFLARLDAAVIEKEKMAYPLDTCIVMKGKLDEMGEPYDAVLNGRLVRFCCDGCVSGYWKEPAKHLDALAKAWRERAGAGGSEGKGHGGH